MPIRGPDCLPFDIDADEWIGFWLDLQAFVALLCERYLGAPIYFNGGANSDADGLVHILRQSARAETLVSLGAGDLFR
jgi:hypothetical protein